jgi:uncharacterized membrane protein
MSRRWFRLLGAVITLTVVALIGWSIATENAVVPIPAAIIGLMLLYLLRRQVRDVVEDERNYKISEKASRFAMQVFAVVAAISGVTLTALSTNDSTPPLREVGLTLAFCACGLSILYLIAYAYHSRKI